MTTEAETRTRLEQMVSAASAPVLVASEIDTLMEIAKSGLLRWRSGAEYGVGAIVVPTSGVLDHQYRVTVGGLAGSTEPSWPLAADATVTQGAVTYQEDGSPERWDLYGAAAEGWLLKAGKAAGRFDFSADGQTYDRSQVHAAAMKMRGEYLALAIEEKRGGPSRRRGLRTIELAPSDSHVVHTGNGLEYHPHSGPDDVQEV